MGIEVGTESFPQSIYTATISPTMVVPAPLEEVFTGKTLTGEFCKYCSERLQWREEPLCHFGWSDWDHAWACKSHPRIQSRLLIMSALEGSRAAPLVRTCTIRTELLQTDSD